MVSLRKGTNKLDKGEGYLRKRVQRERKKDRFRILVQAVVSPFPIGPLAVSSIHFINGLEN